MVAARPEDQLVIARGENVRLRLRTRGDAEDEFRWRSDPENARFDGRPANTMPFQSFLDAFVYELSFGRNDREQFAIDDAEGNHIGTVMLYNFGAGHESAEFGISLGEEPARGQGLGREATATFVRWVWNNRPVRTIFLHCLEWNERAIRAFRAAGFAESARVYRDGQALLRMEARREWWLLWDMEGRFTFQRAAANQGESAANLDEASAGGR